MLESLPGVGKVQARRIMAELDISESRRLRGLGRNQRAGAARSTSRSQYAAPDLGVAPRPRRPLGGRQGHRRPQRCSSASRASGGRSRRPRVPPRPGEVDGVDYHFVDPRRVRGAPRRRRVPRVVRGLRRPEGHAASAGRGAPRGRATTSCSRSTSRARWRSQEQFPGGAARVRDGARRARSSDAGSRARGDRRSGRAVERRLDDRGRPRRRWPTDFDAVVVNDDVDAGRRRGRWYPERPPQRRERLADAGR